MIKNQQVNESPVLDIINDTDEDVEAAALVEITAAIFGEERPGQSCFATLYLCDDEQMQKFNHQYRGAQQATDVLAFAATHGGLEAGEDAANSFLGDIVVDINQAHRQKGSSTINKEIQILLIHGLLHLLGYDHIKTQDKINMEQKENYYKRKLVGS